MRPLIAPEPVQAAMDAMPSPARACLLNLRALIIEVAAAHEEIGPLTETLKWGEPSYAAPTGTPVRLAWKPATPGIVKLCVHCQTSLIETWRAHYGDTFTFEGTRALLLDIHAPLPREALSHCIAMALTYRLK